jgi:hypothetical protein
VSFTQEQINQVWERARAFGTRDMAHWRQDECGAWISREQYGNATAEFGWKIENVSAGGDDSIGNLRAFHRGNHFDRRTARPHCKVTADREDVQPTAQITPPRNREE